jgi:hypothetical protein
MFRMAANTELQPNRGVPAVKAIAGRAIDLPEAVGYMPHAWVDRLCRGCDVFSI